MTLGTVEVKRKTSGQGHTHEFEAAQALWKGDDLALSTPSLLPCPPWGTSLAGVTTWGLVLIGDDATDKVGLCGPQIGHQLVEVLLGRERGESTRGQRSRIEAAVTSPSRMDQPTKDWAPQCWVSAAPPFDPCDPWPSSI